MFYRIWQVFTLNNIIHAQTWRPSRCISTFELFLCVSVVNIYKIDVLYQFLCASMRKYRRLQLPHANVRGECFCRYFHCFTVQSNKCGIKMTSKTYRCIFLYLTTLTRDSLRRNQRYISQLHDHNGQQNGVRPEICAQSAPRNSCFLSCSNS